MQHAKGFAFPILHSALYDGRRPSPQLAYRYQNRLLLDLHICAFSNHSIDITCELGLEFIAVDEFDLAALC